VEISIVAFIILVVVIGLNFGSGRPSSTPVASDISSASSSTFPTVPPVPPVSTPQLGLLAAHGYIEYGYYKVEGQVKNLSDGPLQNVAAVVNWYDSAGNFVKSDDALIQYNPILAGQTSPFTTITTGNPEMKRYTVEFKELMGGTIAHSDMRKKRGSK
jgi:hypothetical protein